MTDDDAELFSAALPLEGPRWDPNRMPDEAVALDDALARVVALSHTHPDPRPGAPTGWATAQALERASMALRSEDCGWYWLADETSGWMVPAAAALPDDITMDVAALPEPHGFVALEHEVLTPGGDGLPCPMRGLVWTSTLTETRERAVLLVFFSDLGGSDGHPAPAGWSVWVHGDGLTDRCGPADPDAQAWDRRFLTVLWYLVTHPKETRGGHVVPERAARRRARRAGVPGPRDGVRVVYLDPDDGPERGEPRPVGSTEHEHRWWVRSHWRSQPYGPGRRLRRLQRIPRHLRGPDRAPVLPPRRTVKAPRRP